MAISIYFLWGSITVVGLVCSLSELINSKKTHDKQKNSANSKIGLILSSVSAILFAVAGIIFMYFLLIFTVEKPLLNTLLYAISLWPVIAGCLLIISIELKIKSIRNQILHQKAKIMLEISILLIVLYYFFYGGVLYYVLQQ